MEPDRAKEIAERDQLWASLRGLRSQINALLEVEFGDPQWVGQTVQILARIVAAELDFRQRTSE